jgi:hypothetical protein
MAKLFYIICLISTLLMVIAFKSFSLLNPTQLDNITIMSDSNNYDNYEYIDNVYDIPITETKIKSSIPVLEEPLVNYQFFPNLRFDHTNISYNLTPYCKGEEQTLRIPSAFTTLHNKVPALTFYETNGSADIEIICHSDVVEEGDFYTMGEAYSTYDNRTNILLNGHIDIYAYHAGVSKCHWGGIELHEILHILGFEHETIYKQSIMNPEVNCKLKLQNYTINELNRLYPYAY